MSTQEKEPERNDYVLVESGDLDDAENVNVLNGHPNLSDYVVGEGSLEPHDIGGGDFDITGGKWYVMLDTEVTSRTNEIRHNSLLTGYIYERTGVDLADSSEDNLVFMDPHLGTDNSPKIEVRNPSNLESSTDEPRDEWLHIATIHPDGNWTPYNRAPDAVFDRIEATTIVAEEGNFETVEIDKIIYEDGEEQTEPGIRIGERINNPNDYYDAISTEGENGGPPGVVHAAVYADYATRVKPGGKVPASALVGPLDIINRRYETTGDSGTPVDNAEKAENSDKVQGRDTKSLLYENALKQPQVVVPRAKIKSGTPSGMMVEMKGDNLKLWSYRISTPNGEDDAGVRFRIRGGNGDIIYEGYDEVKEGDYINKNPLISESRGRVHLELYHERGNEVEASAIAGWTVE